MEVNFCLNCIINAYNVHKRICNYLRLINKGLQNHLYKNLYITCKKGVIVFILFREKLTFRMIIPFYLKSSNNSFNNEGAKSIII
jgi:hypothetical protein